MQDIVWHLSRSYSRVRLPVRTSVRGCSGKSGVCGFESPWPGKTVRTELPVWVHCRGFLLFWFLAVIVVVIIFNFVNVVIVIIFGYYKLFVVVLLLLVVVLFKFNKV